MIPVNRLGLATFVGIAVWGSVAIGHAADRADEPGDVLRAPKAEQPSLQRLKQRSARDRWNRLKEQLGPTDQQQSQKSQSSRESGSKSRTADSGRFGGQSRILFSAQPETSPQQSPDLTPQPESRYPEPVRDPSELKKITEIRPFYDYTPQPTDDPCEYICPRPEGPPCKEYPEGEAPACPEEVMLSDARYEGREFPESLFVWEASNIYYNPLYFEDPALERYGHTYNHLLQPFVSAQRFAVQLIGLPYQMTIDPIHERHYALGWYRPGDCAPYLHYQVPWNSKAAAVEGGVLTGLFFAFP